MESSKVGYWLQIGANIGIFAGLVLVGVAINQNSELTKDRLYFDRWAENFNLRHAMFGDNPGSVIAKAKTNPADLSPREAEVVAQYMSSNQEVGQFIVEVRNQSGNAALALEFTILTAARTNEVVNAKWSEVRRLDSP